VESETFTIENDTLGIEKISNYKPFTQIGNTITANEDINIYNIIGQNYILKQGESLNLKQGIYIIKSKYEVNKIVIIRVC